MSLLSDDVTLGLQLSEGGQPAGAVPGQGGGLGHLPVLGLAQRHLHTPLYGGLTHGHHLVLIETVQAAHGQAGRDHQEEEGQGDLHTEGDYAM